MRSLKEYEEQIEWIKSDGYKWGLRFALGLPGVLCGAFFVTIIAVFIMEQFPSLEPYTRYNCDEIVIFCCIFGYLLGFLVACMYIDDNYVKKEIAKVKKEREEGIREFKRLYEEVNP